MELTAIPGRCASVPAAAAPTGSIGPSILQVVLNLEPGGTQRLVIEIVKSLQDRFPMTVCCLDERGEWSDELLESGVDVVALGRRAGFRPSLAARIAALAASKRASIIHCHHYSPFVYGQIAVSLTAGRRLIFTEHGRLSDASPSRRRWLANQVLARLPATVFAVSQDLRQHMVHEGFPASRVQVLYNGITVGRVPSFSDRIHARLALGVPQESYLVSTIGRLDPVKDIPTLIEGFARFHSSVQDARLLIVGDGTDRERIQGRISALGLDAACQFLGPRRDARQLLPASDAYVNSSTSEGISLTILEAMAAQVPIVATCVGGTPEVIAHESTGLLVSRGDGEAISSALFRLRNHPQKARELASAARARVQHHFSIERMVERYAHAYAAQSLSSAKA